MKLYGAIDLHSNNSYLGILDENGNRYFKKRLDNEPDMILQTLSPFQKDIAGIVVESTYNWYWLVDLLMDHGYRALLANPAAIQQYSGLKHVDDKHDAFWLAELFRLNILPQGYIYPKENRPVRDLFRKRGHLVRLRTSLIISLQNIIARNYGGKLKCNDIKKLTCDLVSPVFDGHEDLSMAGTISKESIDFLTRQIKTIESAVEKKAKPIAGFHDLQTIPGVGKIISLAVLYETGPITRFPSVGDYASYCRKVESKWTSNKKQKGKGNRKNGNKYLAWAFSEAAESARRFDPDSKAFYQRKMKQSNFMIAHNALAHKLCRAAYYIIRDQVPFRPEKLFSQGGTRNQSERMEKPAL